jgi:NitT/TauT family transport system substrate-binding protein
MRTKSIAAAAAAAVLCLAAGCGGSDSPAGTADGDVDEVTVGILPIIDTAPIYLGVEKGFFTKRGIKVTLEKAQGGAVIVPSVVSGEFQFGFSNVTSLLIARSKGLPLKVVAAGNYSTGQAGADFGAVVVPAGSTLQTAADLAGRSVGVNNLNNIGDTTVKASVRKAGGDPSAVKFVEISFPDAPAALSNKRVDAAWVVEPFLTVARSQGARPLAWNLVDTDPNLMVAAYFTTDKLVADNPDLVNRFREAVNESLAYAQQNPDEARRIVGTYTTIAADVAAKLTLPRWSPDINRESVQRLADLAKGDGLVKEAPDVAGMLP